MRRLLRLLVPMTIVVSLAAPPAAHAATVNYVALGDSYSSGVGTDVYNLSLSCLRGTAAYPWLVAVAKGYALNFQACSGATTADVINKQVGALNANTNLVTVTAGGNDAGFASLIVNCTFSNCVSSVNNTITWVNTQLAARLDAMNLQIRVRAPHAVVVVLGYPHLFTSTCLNALGISSSEVTAANNLADALDNVTRTEAAKFGFVYKSAIAQFTNHGVCASSAWIHGVSLTIVDSYHPTSAGHSSGYAPLVRQVTG